MSPDKIFELRGFITDRIKRIVGTNNRSSMVRFPPPWFDRLLEDVKSGSKPFVDIKRVMKPNGAWVIVIEKFEEDPPIG